MDGRARSRTADGAGCFRSRGRLFVAQKEVNTVASWVGTLEDVFRCERDFHCHEPAGNEIVSLSDFPSPEAPSLCAHCLMVLETGMCPWCGAER